MILKRLSLITTLCLVWASMFAQGVCGHPKAERVLMRMAEVEIDGFFCDSIMVEYPIYNVEKKMDLPSSKTPTDNEIEKYFDIENAELEGVLVKTRDNVVWYLSDKGDSKNDISYEKNSEKEIKRFNFLDGLKPDKVYVLSKISNFIITEKDKNLSVKEVKE